MLLNIDLQKDMIVGRNGKILDGLNNLNNINVLTNDKIIEIKREIYHLEI